MKQLYIETYGCQMNVADSEVVASIMKMAGYDLCDNEADADAIFLKVHDHAVNAAVKLQKLAVAAAAEPVDPDDPVADLGHGAVIVYDFLLLKIIYSLAQICAYFGRRIAFHASSSPSICSVSRRS